ncbi:hypothetical protein DENSPDRAFT_842291 [Dentipellis sp. KUC8613]|nr:hypothetical protein DENSPDRAFT_842291 [Dentipellis sp. KUC8613]
MSTPADPAANAARDAEEGTAGAPTRMPERPRSSIPSFLFLTFILFMMTNNNNGDDIATKSQYEDAIQSLEWQLGNYTAWLGGNVTEREGLNFTMPTRLPADVYLVNSFVPAGLILDPATSSYFPNITGFVRGHSHIHNLSSASDVQAPWSPYAKQLMRDANMTEVTEQLGSWNWTASEKVSMSLSERPIELSEEEKKNGTTIDPENIELAMMHGKIELTDANDAEELRFDFEGIHFPKNGSLYGFATPSGTLDLRLLPSLVPPSVSNDTAYRLIPELQERLKKLRALLKSGTFDGSVESSILDETPPRTRCRFAVYAQLHPTNIPAEDMRELEQELQRPTGVSTVPWPRMELRGALVSTECGLVVEIGDTEGLRSRKFFRKITTYAGFAGAVYLMLLLLLSRQMARSRTPAALGRISRWSFLTQAVADSIAFAGHITFAILADGRPSLSLVAPAFLACTLFAYEVQFALLITQVQAPEDAASAPRPPAPAPPPPQPAPPAAPAAPSPAPTPDAPDTEAGEAGPNPAPAAAPTPAPTPTPTTPAPASPSIIDAFRAFFSNDTSSRTWILFVLSVFLLVRLVVAPSLSFALFAALYASFWAPQIVRAARRGRACGLSAEYVVGTSAGRLAVAMYFLSCPKNVLEIEPRGWMLPLALVIFLQLGILALQARLGTGFFLPSRYSPTTPYNYHPPLPLPGPTAGDPEAAPPASLGDCSICMDAIRPPAADHPGADEGKGMGKGMGGDAHEEREGLLARRGRREYSLAPCGHLFHTECLERWLEIKNICPQCRRPLPPL